MCLYIHIFVFAYSLIVRIIKHCWSFKFSYYNVKANNVFIPLSLFIPWKTFL